MKYKIILRGPRGGLRRVRLEAHARNSLEQQILQKKTPHEVILDIAREPTFFEREQAYGHYSVYHDAR